MRCVLMGNFTGPYPSVRVSAAGTSPELTFTATLTGLTESWVVHEVYLVLIGYALSRL